MPYRITYKGNEYVSSIGHGGSPVVYKQIKPNILQPVFYIRKSKNADDEDYKNALRVFLEVTE